jgi:ABC-type nitrate/sulfonate/bicarbonate transport system substrate-binding protein
MNFVRTSIALVSAVLTLTSGVSHAQPVKDISIALASRSFATAAIPLAEELGLFMKNALAPKITVMENASSATAALISGSVEVAVSGPGEMIAAQGRGIDVVAVACGYKGFAGSLILSKKVADSLSVSPTAPVDERLKALSGLTIASTSATGAYTIAFRSATAAASAKNVEFVYMAQPAMLAALGRGVIQGFVAGAPYSAIALVSGSGVIWIPGPQVPRSSSSAIAASIQMMRNVADADPARAKSLAQVFADLSQAIAQRPAEVRAALGRLFPDIEPATMDIVFASESPAWQTDPITVEDMKHDIEVLKMAGAPIPNIERLDPATLIYAHSK